MNELWLCLLSYIGITKPPLVKSLRRGEAYMHQLTGSSLDQIMACHLYGTKPLQEPVLCCCQLDPNEQTSVKSKTIHKHFLSFWKLHLKMSFAICGTYYSGFKNVVHWTVFFIMITLWSGVGTEVIGGCLIEDKNEVTVIKMLLVMLAWT